MEFVLKNNLVGVACVALSCILSSCATTGSSSESSSSVDAQPKASQSKIDAGVEIVPISNIKSEKVVEIVSALRGISVTETVKCAADLDTAYDRLNSIEKLNPFGWKKEKRAEKSVQYANAAKVIEVYFDKLNPSDEEISAAQGEYQKLSMKRNAADQLMLRNINHQFYKRADKCAKKFGVE